jgi:hypothetical protein
LSPERGIQTFPEISIDISSGDLPHFSGTSYQLMEFDLVFLEFVQGVHSTFSPFGGEGLNFSHVQGSLLVPKEVIEFNQ